MNVELSFQAVWILEMTSLASALKKLFLVTYTMYYLIVYVICVRS